MTYWTLIAFTVGFLTIGLVAGIALAVGGLRWVLAALPADYIRDEGAAAIALVERRIQRAAQGPQRAPKRRWRRVEGRHLPNAPRPPQRPPEPVLKPSQALHHPRIDRR